MKVAKGREKDTLIVEKATGDVRYMRIVGETSRSWISSWHNSRHQNYSEKIPKAKWRIASDEERFQYEWLWSHRGRISDAVKQVRVYGPLRQIADIVGYHDEELGQI
jgi:hypothetical protein